MGDLIYIGGHKVHLEEKEVKGEMLNLQGEVYYKISNVDQMRPFFMSLVSDSNHWMFISSNGGLTAGRKDADHALFPYYTDDKITESAGVTGSKTIVRVHQGETKVLWEPFSDAYRGLYRLSRNLYKNSFGNKIIFEEVNHDLQLVFSYEWNSSNKYGFVRKCTLENTGPKKVELSLLDGLQNLLPAGLSADLQNTRSNLVDAYKKNELEEEVGLGTYALSSIIVDKAEPSEALKATLVWSTGFEKPGYLLSSRQLDSFRQGLVLITESEVKAEKGAYFLHTELKLEPKETKKWMIIANVNQSVTQLQSLSKSIRMDADLPARVQTDIEAGTAHLIALTAAADGLQLSRDKLLNTRHFANTLFNIMRGGVFDDNYQIEKRDFVTYLASANRNVFKDNRRLLDQFPEKFLLNELRDRVRDEDDVDIKRLCLEYLPLKFSRRHGDPSRPWNKFSINTRSEIDGSKILDYEGNWRDIFQNWEALAHAYPEFMESMIHKFLNATTFDGYNPYRVTKGGFDWETIEPDDPWSFIGYWGDHQLIYLLKFLEFIEDYYPDTLAGYIDKNLFVYANVPYKIKSYAAILDDPKDTIDFDGVLDEHIRNKKNELGADGALLRDRNGEICRVNLVEKLLATVLAKISNFIPEGGIWMNTQRPEWNDANNALVGNGVSMVTLYYLKRFIHFFDTWVKGIEFDTIEVSAELAPFFTGVLTTFERYNYLLDSRISNTDRKKVLDGLGMAAGTYRWNIYEKGFSGERQKLDKASFISLFDLTGKFLDHTIASNERKDHLYHSYNLMSLQKGKDIEISRLPVMLEGQVAVLSSGYLNSEKSLDLLDALKASPLFREDQYSYLLYPDKELPRFSKKNNIPHEGVENSRLLTSLIENGDSTVVEMDVNGDFHFNGSFNNANSLSEAIDQLPSAAYGDLIELDRKKVLALFEEIFDHKSFTGRSGTFFGYEGLGSIYWHMVSKLLLATQENCIRCVSEKEDSALSRKLMDHFYEIKEGIGVHKPPQLYGAFPTDPYSHTPATKGAQQPGMTGQVKEDILSRIYELGVCVKDGILAFNPLLLRKEEFLNESQTFTYYDINGKVGELKVEENALAFTCCQVPVIYHLSETEMIHVYYGNGKMIAVNGLKFDQKISLELFSRNGSIKRIEVFIPDNGDYFR